MLITQVHTVFRADLATAKDTWNYHVHQTAFMQRAMTCLRLTFLATYSAASGLAQQALTWAEVRDRFEATNPTLIASRVGLDQSRAAEITAYLRPNPDLTGTIDQINPFATQPSPSGSGQDVYRPFTNVLPFGSVSYLHER